MSSNPNTAGVGVSTSSISPNNPAPSNNDKERSQHAGSWPFDSQMGASEEEDGEEEDVEVSGVGKGSSGVRKASQIRNETNPSHVSPSLIMSDCGSDGSGRFVAERPSISNTSVPKQAAPLQPAPQQAAPQPSITPPTSSKKQHGTQSANPIGRPPNGASFLDGLSEEEKRTRCRHLPSVEGFRKLHKSEWKQDLKLCRASLLANGNLKANERNGQAEERRDADGRQESNGNDLGRGIFLSPVTVNGDVTADDPTTKATLQAFNPPRPPELRPPAKLARKRRWERFPEEISSDISDYGKTVQKVKQELWDSKLETEVVGEVGDFIRNHLRCHLNCLREESGEVDSEYGKLEDTIRGVGVDGIEGVLREIHTPTLKTDNPNSGTHSSQVDCKVGIGGVNINRSTHTDTTHIATGWIVPGDAVRTPYGNGTVLEVHPCTPNNNISVHTLLLPPRVSIQLSFAKLYLTSINMNLISTITKKGPKTYTNKQLNNRWNYMINQAMDMGGYQDTQSMNKHRPHNDHNDHHSLNKILNSAMDRIHKKKVYRKNYTPHSSNANHSSLEEDTSSQTSKNTQNTTEDETSHDCFKSPGPPTLKNNWKTPTNTSTRPSDSTTQTPITRIVPFGTHMLNTVSDTRGGPLVNLDYQTLQQVLSNTIDREQPPLINRPSNPQIPAPIQTWESQLNDQFTCKARKLQLRNQLTRHSKVRVLNQRSVGLYQQRTRKIQSLMMEMKQDLKSLKERLRDELNELGISREKAEIMLGDSYHRGTHTNDTETYNDMARQKTRIKKRQKTDKNQSSHEFSRDQASMHEAV